MHSCMHGCMHSIHRQYNHQLKTDKLSMEHEFWLVVMITWPRWPDVDFFKEANNCVCPVTIAIKHVLRVERSRSQSDQYIGELPCVKMWFIQTSDCDLVLIVMQLTTDQTVIKINTHVYSNDLIWLFSALQHIIPLCKRGLVQHRNAFGADYTGKTSTLNPSPVSIFNNWTVYHTFHSFKIVHWCNVKDS